MTTSSFTASVYNPDDIAQMSTPELNDLIHRLSIESAIREATRRSREEMKCPVLSTEEALVVSDYYLDRWVQRIHQNPQEGV